jgi:DNA-binding CsgD family transcriptional regulator
MSAITAAAAQRQRWEYLRSLFENSPEAVGLLDGEMRLVVWNRAAAGITGYSPAEMLGRLCSMDGGRFTVHMNGGGDRPRPPAIARGAPALCEFEVDEKEGGATPINVLAGLTPLRHEDVAFLIHIVPPVRFPLEVPAEARLPHRSLGARRGRRVAGATQPGALRVLTRREHEILSLLAAGKTAKPIAAELALSLTTVRTHIQHILRKLGVHSCLEAVVCLLRARLEDPTTRALALGLGPLLTLP